MYTEALSDVQAYVNASVAWTTISNTLQPLVDRSFTANSLRSSNEPCNSLLFNKLDRNGLLCVVYSYALFPATILL